jgi:hypothetical protein
MLAGSGLPVLSLSCRTEEGYALHDVLLVCVACRPTGVTVHATALLFVTRAAN